MTRYDDQPETFALVVPDHQRENPCYHPARSYEHGYTDGRFFSGRRRPGAVRGRDANYDAGLGAGLLDALELDDHMPAER